MAENNEIPRWDMSSIFSGFGGKDYEDAFTTITNDYKKLDELIAGVDLSPDFGAWLKEYIEISNKADALLYSLSAYTEAVYTTDTTDPVAMNNCSRIEKMMIPFRATSLNFQKVLTAHAQDLPKFYTTYPQFADYEYIFSHYLESFKHTMPVEMETLAAELQQTGGNAWGNLQQSIIANLVDAETGKTFNELRNDAYSADPAVRLDSFKREVALLKGMEIPLANCLNNLKGETVALLKRRNWNSALDRSMFYAHASKETIDALIGAIEDSLPFWHDYLKTKAKAVSGADALPFYDLFAPLPAKGADAENAKETMWKFAEAKDYIIERFSSFSQDMGDFARYAFEHNWIDAEIRKGKVGGAYCTSFPAHKESRVLANFTGTFSDVFTLSHELGHAYHAYCIKDADTALADYPMTLAETASIFAETVVMKDLLKQADGFERARLCETHLSDGCQVLVDILSRFYFERSVFERRGSEELNAADFCALMTKAQENTYGPGMSEKHPYMWALKSHYYSTGLDFYNYPYAFGQLFGLGLYACYEKEGKAFTEKYKELLVDTGKMSCEDVCRKAGFDITKKEFWKNAIAQYADELATLKEYVNN